MLQTRLFSSSQDPCLGLDSLQKFQAYYLQGDLVSIHVTYMYLSIYVWDTYMYVSCMVWSVHTCALCRGSVFWFCSLCFTWQCGCRSCSVLFPQPDPKQKTIFDLFQKTFSEIRDDADDVLFLEAADVGCEFDSGSALQDREAETCSVSPKKKRRIEEM